MVRSATRRTCACLDGGVLPMLATKGDHVPGAGWTHEVKWDGMRVLVDRTERGLRIWSRNENDVTVSFPELHALAACGDDFLLDGEVVALGEGVPSFGALADRMHVRDANRARRLAEKNPVTLIAFDLLRYDGEDLCALPLAERRLRLEALGLDRPTMAPGTCLRRTTTGRCCTKRRSSRVSRASSASGCPRRTDPGQRSRDWLKFPIRPTGSYVVGGFRHETGSTHRLGAVLVGQPTERGLEFRGRVGSGIGGKAGPILAEQLLPLVTSDSPFTQVLPRLDLVGTVWVQPKIVVDVQFLTLTTDGRLRQPAYRGVRTDLAPEDLIEGNA